MQGIKIWESNTPDCDRTLRALFEQAVEEIESDGGKASGKNIKFALQGKISRAFHELMEEKTRTEMSRIGVW